MFGCSPAEVTQPPPPDFGVTLTPYRTAAPRATPPPGATPPATALPPTALPAPTPTPLVYTVVANDTLIGIAVRYAVPLDNLLAANPGIDPNFLTIGMTLTIPVEGIAAATQPTPTPEAVSLQEPVCYPLGDGRVQCLSVLVNENPFALENIAVEMVLQTTDGEFVSGVAVPPLNLLPSGSQTAVTMLFAPPAAAYTPQAAVLSAIQVLSGTQRYLPVEIRGSQIDFTPNSLQAEVSGTLFLPAAQPDATTVWIAAFAYDENANIVGFRKWVADDALPAGGEMAFRFGVYSLGLPIARLDLQVEARP